MESNLSSELCMPNVCWAYDTASASDAASQRYYHGLRIHHRHKSNLRP